MAKTRKTKREKIISERRRVDAHQFRIKQEWLTPAQKRTDNAVVLSTHDKRYFRLDLTKTFFLTMLVLALELALWQYLTRH